ncbi:hypothetical protein LZ906_017430 (plasmid) [Paraclostridium ghonii]|uniref:hypothetical protein n=1 Tax=Paraclostridium ghonii TaxID=29358 RepID=UPI00202CC6AE|nr:hypothetical protein [Paeniclostridium ghonii]MCM0166559.1 hypothetical protein [Paeniclostridium ghonii]
MRDLLKKIKKANFYDLKAIGEFEDKKLCTLEDSKNFNYKETKLFKELNKLDENRLDYVIVYILTGRELSRYYGTTLKIKFTEYVDYFNECDIINKNHKLEKIKYVCFKSQKLNNYIDTVLKYI